MIVYKAKFKKELADNKNICHEIQKLITSDSYIYLYKHGLDMHTSERSNEFMMFNLNICIDISELSQITKMELKDF